MYVLGTNIVIAALNGVPAVKSKLSTLDVADIGIPLPVAGELLYGAHRSTKKAANLQRIAQLRATFTVLPVDEAVVERYGRLRADLHARGLSRSDFDLLIVCSAMQHGAVLVTHDQALHDDFRLGLQHQDWLAS